MAALPKKNSLFFGFFIFIFADCQALAECLIKTLDKDPFADQIYAVCESPSLVFDN